MAISQEKLLFSLVQGEDGRSWASSKKGWNVTERPPVHVCCWTGVSCGDDGSTVTGIDIAGSDFVGTIPDELGQLTTLTSINMRRNLIQGTIPRAVSDLPNLETIDVSENHIIGPLPLFSSQGLVRVIASDNVLSGPIPDDFGYGHDQLLEIDMQKNQLNGTIPLSIGALTSLEKLSLSENHFHGSIPENFGSLKSLQFIYLDRNQFIGTIPRSLTPVDSSLREVWLQGNLLSGTVPSAFAEMENLKNLYVNGNKLTGQLPRDLCNGEINADFFDDGRVDRVQGESCSTIACPVGTASPEGVFPCDPCYPGTYNPYLGREGSCITRDARQILTRFWLETDGPLWTGTNNWFFDGVDHCDFTGVTCNEEGAVTSIVLKNMGLRGTLIEDIGFLEHLRRLDLSDNQLYLYVPSDLRFAPLDELDLSGNQLEGMVPPMLCLLGNVNGNGAGGQYDCDRIICPAGTYSPTGRAGDGHSCQRCDDGLEFVGRKSCSDSYGASSSLDEEMSKTGPSLIVVALITVIILSSVLGFLYYNRRNASGTEDVSDEELRQYDQEVEEGENIPPPSQQLCTGTFPDSDEVQKIEDDVSVVTHVRRKKSKKRRTKHHNYGHVAPGNEEQVSSFHGRGRRRGAKGENLQHYNQVGMEDEGDREKPGSKEVWLDLPKMVSVAEPAIEPNTMA